MSDCPICISPLISTVHSMQETGVSYDEIGETCALDPADIEQHFQKCCEPIVAGTAPDSLQASDERLRQLQQKISLVAVGAGLAGDVRSQVSALSLSLRTELEVRARLEERVKVEAEKADNPDKALTIASLDAAVREYTVALDSKTEGIAEKVQSLLIESPEAFGKLVLAVWADRGLLERLTSDVSANN
jgi:DNA-binding transcriptional MerR regulator